MLTSGVLISGVTIQGSDPLARPQRWYVRCRECLSVAAVDTQSGRPGAMVCDLCDGAIEIMGRVESISPAPWQAGGLVNDSLRLACDARCQGAQGPKCDCQCRGENHGQTVLVRTVEGAGGVPRVCILDKGKALARVAEWRALVAEWETAFEAYREPYERKQRGEYVSSYDFGRYMDARRWRKALGETRDKRTHKGRMDVLRGIVERMRKGDRP